jgi:hypothetical protein
MTIPVVTRLDSKFGNLQVLAVKRKDGGAWTLPGTARHTPDTSKAGADLRRQAGVWVDVAASPVTQRNPVDDPRNTDNAWIEGTMVHAHLEGKVAAGATPRAGGDAKYAQWLNNLDLGCLDPGHDAVLQHALQGAAETAGADIRAVAKARADPVGEAKVGQILGERAKAVTVAMKAEFLLHVRERLQRNDSAHSTVHDVMRSVIRDFPGRFSGKGETFEEQSTSNATTWRTSKEGLPPRVLTRTLSPHDLYHFYISDDVKARLQREHGITDGASFGAAVNANPAIFVPERNLDPASVITGGAGVGWWGLARDSKAASMADLVKDYGLDPTYYPHGCYRVSIDVNQEGVILDVAKPTAFDGAMFKEWAEAPKHEPTGVTSGGRREVVIHGIAMRQVSHAAVFAYFG